MGYKVISKCPICGSGLKVTRLKCSNCNTVIENEFELSKLGGLNEEQLYFVEIFMKCRGNIKEVEKELGVSYPTVRAKLDEVIGALGFAVPKQSAEKNDAIIDALEKGEISPDEAVKLLNK